MKLFSKWSLVGLATATLVSHARPSRAETTASQRAAAEALFQQAVELLDQKRYAEACEKLAGSQDLDPALGTMLYLADCYEHSGRTASAWALFHEAADTAQRTGQADRQRIALERAKSLEARLSKLQLKVSAERRVQGLELLVNGTAVPSASWNSALPVDPGPTRLEARAPGKRTWNGSITIVQGPASQSMEVPRLLDAPRPPPRPVDQAAYSHDEGSAQRLVGYVMTAAGVVALGAGGYFGYRAYSLNKKSKAECRADDPNACTTEGVDLRDDAKTAGALSTVGTVGGALLSVAGIALVATAPGSSSTREQTRSAAAPGLGLGFSLRGEW
jgi:tetratricopeptide (TPR) repeat protein